MDWCVGEAKASSAQSLRMGDNHGGEVRSEPGTLLIENYNPIPPFVLRKNSTENHWNIFGCF